jgi:hypothetical protein
VVSRDPFSELWRHVCRGSSDDPAGICSERSAAAEVDEHTTTTPIDEDVRRLEVAVAYAEVVEELQRCERA